MRRVILFTFVILLWRLGINALLAEDATPSSALPPIALAISSISVDGTNLSVVAVVPPALDQLALELSPSLNGDWQEAGAVNLPEGGQLTFTLPKPSTPTAFFRLRAKRHLENTPILSSELQYVAVPSLASNLSDNGDALFHFKGLVDGSDKIVITRDGALWNHVNWAWPQGAVTINGTEWKPEDKNYMTTVGGTKFLPETFSLESVNLEVIQGRDVVALERTPNALTVYVNDTPIGPAEYEFTIRFHHVPPQRPASTGTIAPRLKIAARIDGSDCLTITPTAATWEHKFFACPTSVTLNDIHWNPKKNKVLKNEGTNTFLPAGVDLSTAKIVSRKGRDLTTLWAENDSLQIRFADNPNGADYYELEISFGESH